MSYKAAFNAEEWSVVAQAPLLVGARVVAAEHGGTLRESFAIGQVYKAARELRGESALLDELVSDTPSIDLDDLRDTGDPVAASRERLEAALAVGLGGRLRDRHHKALVGIEVLGGRLRPDDG